MLQSPLRFHWHVGVSDRPCKLWGETGWGERGMHSSRRMARTVHMSLYPQGVVDNLEYGVHHYGSLCDGWISCTPMFLVCADKSNNNLKKKRGSEKGILLRSRCIYYSYILENAQTYHAPSNACQLRILRSAKKCRQLGLFCFCVFA